jgi:hypothetical protein
MTSQAADWRGLIRPHPAAEKFEMMSDSGLDALGKDIVENGLQQPIVVFVSDYGGEKYLLDGRNRLEGICRVIDDPEKRRQAIDEALANATEFRASKKIDAWAYVISANVHRRHLTAEQNREVIAELLKERPERSDRETAKIARVSDKTVGAVRAKLEGRAEIPHVAARMDAKGRWQPTSKTPTARKPVIQPAVTVPIVEGSPPPDAEILPYVAAADVVTAPTETASSATPRRRGRATPTSRRSTPSSSSPAQTRDKAIVGFSTLLRAKLPDTLDDLTRLLRDERGRIIALPHEKRVRLAQAYLDVLGLGVNDLPSRNAG